jgi:imidazolonepropionase-like amidohydrolase
MSIFQLWTLPAPAGDLLVEGGRMFTGLADALQPNPGILIRNGRVVAVGAIEDTVTVERLQLDDDDTILPGLVDLHAHYKIFIHGNRRDETVANPVIYLANGVTTTFTAGELNPYDVLELKNAINRGDRIGPRLLTAGPYFGPTNPKWSKEDSAADVYAQVDKWAALGVDGFKAKRVTPEQLEALIERAHGHGLTVTAHLDSGFNDTVNPSDAVRMGIDRIEHFVGGDLFPPERSAYDTYKHLDPHDPQFDDAIDLFVSHGVSFSATVSTYGQFASDDPALEVCCDQYRYLTPYTREMTEQAVLDEALRHTFSEIYERKKIVIKRFFDRGGVIVLGSDRQLWEGTIPGFAVHTELRVLSEAGIPNADVIRIATINGARAIGLGNQLGTIEAGKLADFFVVSGDPLEDITRTREIHTVVKNGEVFDSKQLLESVVGKLGPETAEDWPDYREDYQD